MDPLSWREGFRSNGRKSHAPHQSHALSWARKKTICMAEGLWLRMRRLRCPVAKGSQGSRRVRCLPVRAAPLLQGAGGWVCRAGS